nr:elongation factor 1-gamma [Quercus suber]
MILYCFVRLNFLFPIEYWIDFPSLEVDTNILAWCKPRIECAIYLPLAEEAALSSLKRVLDALDTYLASNTLLVGNSVTLADIVTMCNLYIGFTQLMTKSFISEFPYVERYFWTMPKESAKPNPKDEPKKEEPAKPKSEPGEEEEGPKSKPKNTLDLLPPRMVDYLLGEEHFIQCGIAQDLRSDERYSLNTGKGFI